MQRGPYEGDYFEGIFPVEVINWATLSPHIWDQ